MSTFLRHFAVLFVAIFVVLVGTTAALRGVYALAGPGGLLALCVVAFAAFGAVLMRQDA